ncbi:MAG: hypothetical protein LQ340_003969, partial [Diploschistes diacapsis]
MSHLREFIQGEAELGTESDDEDFDEDTGESRPKKNGTRRNFEDSSEEEEEDDEEEAERIRADFIVEDEEEPEERERRRKERKKRRREEREEEEANLDEEDLDLIGEANPGLARRVQTEPKFKRLKRGHKEEREERVGRGTAALFDSDEEEEPVVDRRAAREDEFDDFIEEDFPEEEGRGPGEDDDAEVSRMVGRGLGAIKDTIGLDEGALEDFREAFGDGAEYDWALAMEEQEEDNSRGITADGGALSKPIELKDVFEPSQLAEKMLTEKDNTIRTTDEPERFQVARAPYKGLFFTEEQVKEEPIWISDQMLLKRTLPDDLREPFQKAVAKVLEFFNTDEFEVPFIFQHRKDYLIHATRVRTDLNLDNPSTVDYEINAEKLLNQSDLWDIFDWDLKFRALIEKRNSLQKTYDNLKSASNAKDLILDEMLGSAANMEELQDAQDYLYFQYSSHISDMSLVNGATTNGTHRRPGASKMLFERIRSSKVYNLVKAFGITADDFAQNASKKEGRRQYTEDPAERPDRMAESEDVLDPPEYSSGAQCLRAARAMFAEELFTSPRLRKVLRGVYYSSGIIDCSRTEKGLRKIDEQHPYYEFKYLRNQQMHDIAHRPGVFLRMLKAEEEGLIEVRVRLQDYEGFRKSLISDLESDNFSEVADGWNKERRDALDLALAKLQKIMSKGLKENLKAMCESEITANCRENFLARLDQAPYKPKGMVLGTVPRVLAFSNGSGNVGREPTYWVFVEDDGRVLENGNFTELQLGDPDRNTKDGADVGRFCELIARRKPDVVSVSGFSVDTKRLAHLLEELVFKNNLRTADYEDEDGRDVNDKLEVIITNDEVARLYQTSPRADSEYPRFTPLTRYCVALARYLQNPMKEYASLGRDLGSIAFDPFQSYVSQEKILKVLETALVDMVNLVGVDINDAVSDLRTANLLPFVSGLGPRKAQYLLKVINRNGGTVSTRAELVGDAEANKAQAVGPRVWNNCASFLFIEFDVGDPESDYLDNTRVHPEDYELGRKMAADALELDEEDIETEVALNGGGAIVRKLIRDEAQEKVNDLILEEYSAQLEEKFNQKKRATLETIRAELQAPYEELRRNFHTLLSTNEIFTMFTGETAESLVERMNVPMQIKRVSDDSIEGKLDCGIDGVVNAMEISDRMDVSAKSLYQSHQTIQAQIVHINRERFTAEMTLLEEKLQRPFKRNMAMDLAFNQWDERQESKDKENLQVKNDFSARTQRVIKHPLFRSFNSQQAEEFLGMQARGDVVIRPSSKGPDHLAVTWKVSEGVFQHIDVLELDKDNEFSVGRTLKVGGRWSYSDLDDLIVNHVKAMVRKVDEMILHEKYRAGGRADT